MKTLERTIDFVKSFLYYPEMKKYFKNKGMESYNPWNGERMAAFKYAKWHCTHGRLKE